MLFIFLFLLTSGNITETGEKPCIRVLNNNTQTAKS